MTILPNPFMSSAGIPGTADTGAATCPSTPIVAPAPIDHPRGCPDPEWCISNNGCYWNCSYDIAGTDCISEIFHYGRKLLAEDNRRAEDFIDWNSLEAATIEEVPLFIRDGEHLKRWS